MFTMMMRNSPYEMPTAVNRGTKEAVEKLNDSIVELVKVDDSVTILTTSTENLSSYVNTFIVPSYVF